MNLLASKFEMPDSSGPIVERERLLHRLDDASKARLSVVAAPAGAGKTTLGVAWRQSPLARDRPVAWLTLEPRDSEPRRFWSYLVGSLEQLGIEPGSITEQMSDRFDVLADPGAEPFLNLILNALASGPEGSVIVLDDFHYITDQTVLGGIQYLVDHLPRRAHVLMLTRRQPALRLETLRLRSALEEIDGHDLRFSDDEVAALFTVVAGFTLADEEAAAIVTHTEGWAAAVKLGALSLRRSGTVAGLIEGLGAGTPLYLSEFVAHEVLERLEPELRSFVLESAVLAQFTEQMADEILERDDSACLTDRVRREHLFLQRVDGAETVYRYHPLFASLVTRVLRDLDPERCNAIHSRASDWFEARDEIEPAVEHAAEAGHDDRVVELVIDHLPHVTGFLGSTEVVERWVELLGRADGSRSAEGLIRAAWAQALAGHPIEATSLLAELAEPENLDPKYETLAAFARLFVAFGEGNTERIVAAADELADLETPQVFGVNSRRFECEQRGRALLLAEHDEEARLTLHRALTARQAPYGPPYVIIPALLAHLDVRAARLTSALRWAEMSLQRALEAGNADAPVTSEALSARAGVRMEQGDAVGAQRDLELALARAQLMPNPGAACLALQQLARLNIARGDHEVAALNLAALADQYRWGPMPESIRRLVAYEQLDLAFALDDPARVRLWSTELAGGGELTPASQILTMLVLDDAKRAADQADHIVPSLDHRSTRDVRLRAHCAAARAFIRVGREDDATRAVGRAAELAEPEQMVEVFRWAGPEVAGFIKELGALPRSATRASPRFVERIVAHLTNAGAGDAQPAAGAAESGPLSDRELSVLRLLPSSLSLSEIASELFVSHNTVKTHVKHIYSKLGTCSRAETIDQARAAELIG